ncbi:MAG: DUF2442 domain-containing protein [Oscillospiraceae bacterium]|jgi:hypothetical protein|nr:DUF2442 domain-containing protein [Oscillospiraceae bacterium]
MQIPNDVSEYFSRGRRRVVSVTANDDFSLSLVFDNRETRSYDMKENLKGDVFKPLLAEAAFKRVFVDENGGVAWDVDPNADSGAVWNNRVDICPDSCYLQSVPSEIP